MKKVFVLFCVSLMALVSNATSYDLLVEGLPKGAEVKVGRKVFRADVVGATVNTSHVIAPSVHGAIPYVRVDEANHQVSVRYVKYFDPITSPEDIDSAPSYYITESGNSVYVKVTGENILANKFTGDKFVFIEAENGQYYIYNKSIGAYFYYRQILGTANTTVTSTSAVRYTTNFSTANTWQIVDDDYDGYVDIVPGDVNTITTTTQGWNFRGGVNYALNLYDRSDSNSHWMISGQASTAPLDCPTHVFSLPGNPFMHKLVTFPDDKVTSVSNLPAGITLDTSSRRYAFLRGTAPEVGQYTYTVHLNEGTTEEKSVDVTFDVSEDLNQPTPFMGLLTWNAFQGNISQSTLVTLADALEEYGLKDCGYNYLCIDDQWATKTRTNGHCTLNTDKFTDLKALTDYVHSKDLKIGIYSDAAAYTCSGEQVGSYGYEEVDGQDFVDWGFDLLKYDYCGAPADAKTAETRYRAMYDGIAKAMTAAGRKPSDFMLYMCEWGYRAPWLWADRTGATCWRATDDTREFWSDVTYKGGIIQSIATFQNIWQYTGVNRWNDADMLVVGLHGTGYSSNDGGGAGYPSCLTMNEARTNFALWCMWSSPLTLSNNITNLDGKENTLTGKTVTNTYYKEDLALITNEELIALDQDPLGQCAEPIISTENYIVWAKDLANGDVAISITNLSSDTYRCSVDLSLVPGLEAGVNYKVRNLLAHSDLSRTYTTADTYSYSMPTHLTRVLRFSRTDGEQTDSILSVADNVASRSALSYDVQGRPLYQVHHKGVVITDGQKVLR